MKARIEVLSTETRSGNKNGKDWSMVVCQCVANVLDLKTGQEKISVGELILPKGHEPITAGVFEGEFGISVGQDKQIGGRLLRLTPLANAKSAVTSQTLTASSPKA